MSNDISLGRLELVELRDQWLHEVKFDGRRAQLHKAGDDDERLFPVGAHDDVADLDAGEQAGERRSLDPRAR